MPTKQEMKKATSETVDAMLGTVPSKSTGTAKYDTSDDGIHQTKRALSPSSLPQSITARTNMTDNNQINDNGASNKHNMEMIAQKETLHHIEMAWRAQQRLVRRCLGLRLFGDKATTQSDDINNETDNIKEGK